MSGVAIFIVVVVSLIFLVCVGWSFFLQRHRESPQVSAGWTETNEVFNDPSTNRQMRVWVDASGERHYVEEGHQPST